MAQCKVVLLGNHDYAALADTKGFNDAARRALLWTIDQLDDPEEPQKLAVERRWKFLAGLPLTHRENDFLYVHASPREPLTEYVFPEDAHKPMKMRAFSPRSARYCFVGHTHVPGIFTENRRFHSPEKLKCVYRLDGNKMLCNVGSVGQPRNSNPRACSSCSTTTRSFFGGSFTTSSERCVRSCSFPSCPISEPVSKGFQRSVASRRVTLRKSVLAATDAPSARRCACIVAISAST